MRPEAYAHQNFELWRLLLVKNETAVLIPVRLGSSRLHRKALIPIVGQPALGHLLERMKLATGLSRIVVCTTQEAEDGELVDLAVHLGVDYYRGATTDLIDRLRACLLYTSRCV